jgi:FkbM family methyltransferase
MSAAAATAKHRIARMLPNPVYRLYRRRKVARLITTYKPRTVSHAYGRHRFTIALADPLAEAWYDQDWPVLEEIEELSRAGSLAQGSVVFDIGAHQGVVALMLAAEVGTGGKVIAVEAEPHNASMTRRNVALNRASNVDVVHAAIADRPGTVNFAGELNGHVDPGGGIGNVEVEAVTIDGLAEMHGSPSVVFLDVEGYEGKALAGAARTIRARRTTFCIEVHSDELAGCSVSELISNLTGYELLVAKGSPGGMAERFTSLDGPPPPGRFFLVATPTAR